MDDRRLEGSRRGEEEGMDGGFSSQVVALCYDQPADAPVGRRPGPHSAISSHLH